MHVLVILLLTFYEAVGIETTWGPNGPGFGFQEGQIVFLFSKTSRLALGFTQPNIEWVRGFLPGIKQEGCVVDPSPPSNAMIRNELSSTSAAVYAFMAWTGQHYFLFY